MSDRKRSKIEKAAVPHDLILIIEGKSKSGENGRRQTEAKLRIISGPGLDALWKLIEKRAAPSIIRKLGAQGCNSATFGAIVRSMYLHEQPKRGKLRWTVVMSIDETGIRVVKRLKRFEVIKDESNGE